MGWFKSARPLTRKLSIVPPAPAPGRHGIAIMACVKNEAVYIEEWIRFHRAVGVDHFYIYDDGSTDGTRALLSDLLPANALTIVPWIARMSDTASGQLLNGQTIAFAHAILNFGSLYSRMAFIDVDEFLLPKQGSTIEQALEGAGGFPNVSLPWHMFGTSGHVVKPDGPLLSNYTMRGADPLTRQENVSNFKCIVDPCEVVEVSVHQFRTRQHGELTVNDAGQQFTRSGRKSPAFYSNRFLQLNHYYSKSRAELQAKVTRGWSYDAERTKYERKVFGVVEAIEKDAVEDRAMVDFIARHGIELG
ncbi:MULTISPECIES: glycosyltransferase family 92 protein [Rhizobium]|uniref:Glycosyltransferase family 92 protein n=1 Tax=Rhizobium rhododendri TaxID=2506430 RepID=A0ABY8IGN8_9HYPH|nr:MULTISPECIES: glycosyltransferase family 92 protein [Rhizobium]MBZ5762139.1 glycosyltransferase family 92 protein [Rhizobium sp. VS19-DR96]MBZ5767696.1 glycosyltransferase family 92 protein [Rhizobium sp. VS19-DR129.2]MBZ5775397.1 glycosyltransferase family 92 protein [Rhizobium sp. VS19-DRK62.2]MBZ5786180.1 glycosyltransferase family 92 protein [Rhizobium sp. VS19-DR121]MBZ5803792.1 glycosyltransferase family 92 protein [Rhizobium sp. VS19-DR181]